MDCALAPGCPTDSRNRPSSMDNLLGSLGRIQSLVQDTIQQQGNLCKDLEGQHGVFERLDLVSEEVNDGTCAIAENRETIKIIKQSVHLLVSVVIKQDNELRHLQQEVLDLKTRSMRQNLLVHNVPESKGENVYTVTTTSIAQTIGIDMSNHPIDVCHRMGPIPTRQNRTRPIVVRFTNRRDTDTILQKFREKNKSKGKSDSQNSDIRITPHYPEELQAKRRKLLDAAEGISKASPAAACKTNLNAMTINNQLYKDPIPRPSAKSVLTPDPDVQKAAHKLACVSSEQLSEKGSIFQANASRVSSFAETSLLYHKVCSQPVAASATHNILAYVLPDGTQGYQDDGEHGAGRFLSKWLARNNHTGIAVVVTRQYGGTHLGFRRFELSKDAAQSAIQKLVP